MLTPDTIASIKSVSYDKNGHIKIEMYDKQKAIEQAGRYLKMFTDKTEISGELNINQLTAEEKKERLRDLMIKAKIAKNAKKEEVKKAKKPAKKAVKKKAVKKPLKKAKKAKKKAKK